jgi:type VI protein secretion system component Hcp
MRARLDHLMYIVLGFFGFQAPSANADAVLCFAHPDLQGESVFPGHEGCIDILSWQWGVGNADVTVSKEMDLASPGLALQVSNPAKTVGEANLYQYRCSPSCPGDLLFQATLTDTFITSLSDSSSGDATPFESISLNYSKITYCYTAAGAKAPTCQTLTPPVR